MPSGYVQNKTESPGIVVEGSLKDPELAQLAKLNAKSSTVMAAVGARPSSAIPLIGTKLRGGKSKHRRSTEHGTIGSADRLSGFFETPATSDMKCPVNYPLPRNVRCL